MTPLSRVVSTVLFVAIQTAYADAPLPPSDTVTVCSRSGEVCAESDPAKGLTTVVRKADHSTLWSLRGWHRWLFVPEGGESLVVGYVGMNLVPVDSQLTLEVLRFYSRGKLVKSVKLGELYTDRSQLERTTSHLAWVQSIAINRANQLVLELTSGRRVAFSMSGQSQVEVSGGA